MGTVNKQDNGSNPGEVDQQGDTTDASGIATVPNDTAGTPAESPSSEQLTDGQDSGAFTGIDRTTLTPDMQKMYDSMNGDYTKSKQTLAEQGRLLDSRRDFAAVGELVENNPAINKLVWDAIGQIRAGQSVDTPVNTGAPDDRNAGLTGAQPQAQVDISPEEQAGRNMINEEVVKVVAPLVEQMNNLMGPVSQMSAYMNQNQAATEYQLLIQKYPAAATLRPQELQTKQLQYSRPGGGSINMEEAFLLMAGSNPALLTARPDQTPAGGNPPDNAGTDGSTPTGTERGGARVGSESLAPGTRGFTALKELAANLLKEGSGGIGNAMSRARVKFGESHPNEM